MEQIFTYIAQYGFPIVMCLLMFYYITKVDKNHADEITELRKSVENNTHAINNLLDAINNGKKEE